MKQEIVVKTKDGRYITVKVIDMWDAIDNNGNVKSYATDAKHHNYQVVDREFDRVIWSRLS